ncbi:hypothetical protein BDW62DRAFT_143923 [Aspergillus aurantiobrunneus]
MSQSSGSKPEKNMSSRLLTMKFMQRAAASAATKESSQPASNSESKDSTPKKRRVSAGPERSPAGPSSDLEAISAALAEEEERRKDAISRQAAEAGETEWVLDFGGADTVDQYAQQPLVLADSSLDADDDDMDYGGRQLYGNYKRKSQPKPSNQGAQDGSDPANAQATNQNKPKKPNLDNIISISGAGGRSKPGASINEKPQKKRKHK